MIIHLDEDIFELVNNGTKCVEVRLYDEKRQKLKINDEIIFLKRPLEKESIKTKIVNLVKYDSFSELVSNYNIKNLYKEGITKEEFLNLLNRFYTKDDEIKYGVVAIEFKVL